MDPNLLLDPITAALERPTAPKLTRQQRVAAALEKIKGGAGAKALQAAALAAQRDGNASADASLAIRRNRDLTGPAREREEAALDLRYRTEVLVANIGAMNNALDGVRTLIFAAPPDYAPLNASDATRINGIAADFSEYDPVTAFRVAREAVARGDLPLVKRLRDLLGAFAEWKKPFAQSGETSDVLAAMDDALGTADVVRSEAAAQFVRQAEGEIAYFTRALLAGHGRADPIHASTGALPLLFPPDTSGSQSGPAVFTG